MLLSSVQTEQQQTLVVEGYEGHPVRSFAVL